MATKTLKPKKQSESDELARNRKDVEKLIRLCIELDMEMDGVCVPATAAAILNGIRHILNEYQ